MTTFATDDSLLSTAEAHASLGEWGQLRELVVGIAAERRSPALTLLLAEAQLRTGDLEAAYSALVPLVPLLARHADSELYRRAVNMLGAAAFELGRMTEAEQRFEEALSLANGGGDSVALGRATNNLGMIAHIRGQYDRALAHYQLAVPAYQRIGFTAGLAETHHNMALAMRELGQLDSADKQERRAIEFAREAGNGRMLAIAHVGRAELALRRGEPAVAQAGARLGARQYASIPDAIGEADALRLMGAACTALGETHAASVSLERAVTLARAHGSTLVEAESHEELARLQLALGHWRAAEDEVQEARRLYRQLGAAPAEELLERWYASARRPG